MCVQHSDNRPRLTLFPTTPCLTCLASDQYRGDGDDDDNHGTPGVLATHSVILSPVLTQCLVIAEITREEEDGGQTQR